MSCCGKSCTVACFMSCVLHRTFIKHACGTRMTCTGIASHPARCAAGAALPGVMACPLYLQMVSVSAGISIPADVVKGSLGTSFGDPHGSPSPCPPPRSAPPMASQCPDESVTLAGPAGLIITAVDEDFNEVDDGHAVCAPRPGAPCRRCDGADRVSLRPALLRALFCRRIPVRTRW